MSESSHSRQPTGDGEAGVEAVRAELAELRDRVAKLEQQVGPGESSLPPGASDYRDARVLDALDPGTTVALTTLRSLYLDRTDVREDGTLRQRIEDLVDSSAFTKTGFQEWRYDGPTTDSP